MGILMITISDRALERLVVARVRRRAPLLQFVPDRWIVIAMRPTVRRVRRCVLGGVMLAMGGSGIALAVLLAT